jgi:hypothetical protein
MAKLPDDFPHLTVLQAEGINTEAQLAKFADDYTKIPGIGVAFAADIIAAVAAEPADEKTEPADDKAEATVEQAGRPVHFCLTLDTVVDGIAVQVDDHWDVTVGSTVYQRARETTGTPRQPGEFAFKE